MSDLAAQHGAQFAPPAHPAPSIGAPDVHGPGPQQFVPPVRPAPSPQLAPPVMPPEQAAPAPQYLPTHPAPQYAPPTQPVQQSFDPAQPFDPPQSYPVAQPQYVNQAYDPHANPYAIPRTKPGNGKIIAAYVFSVLSVLILPIIFGPIAIILANKAKNEGNPNGVTAKSVAIGAMCVGFFFGFIAIRATGV